MKTKSHFIKVSTLNSCSVYAPHAVRESIGFDWPHITISSALSIGASNIRLAPDADSNAGSLVADWPFEYFKTTTIHDIANGLDCSAHFNKGGDIALLQRLYDEEGIQTTRYTPDSCHYYPLAKWLSAAPDERASLVC